MSSSNLATLSPSAFGGTYIQNLGVASRVFIAALLAVKPNAPVGSAVAQQQPALSERDRFKSILEMNRLARDFDSAMPNQAAELRYFAVHC